MNDTSRDTVGGLPRLLLGRDGMRRFQRANVSFGRYLLSVVFGIDTRGLAVFRMGLASVVLIDLWNRSSDLMAHYSDLGVLPRVAKISFLDRAAAGGNWWWSLHMASGERFAQSILFLTAAVIALMLFAGYRTRLATLLTWILLVSLHNRNPLILQGGDVLLRCALFWSMFLPLGATMSVDRLRSRSLAPAPTHVLSAASAALMLQVGAMYFFGACQKADPIWTQQLAGVYYALSADHFAKPLGTWLLSFPNLLTLLSWLTLNLEFFGPLIAFMPIRTSAVRLLIVPLFILFHISLALTMALGLFPLIAIVCWIPFLPTRFWDALSHRIKWIPQVGNPNICLPKGILGGVASVLVAVLFVSVVFWNIRQLPFAHAQFSWAKPVADRLPRSMDFAIHLTRLDQQWQMFAPRPIVRDGWFEVPGTLQDGSRVNLWAPGAPLPAKKPDVVSATFPSQRWRKLMIVLRKKRFAHYRRYLGDWLRCRWDNEHARDEPTRRVQQLEITVHVEETRPPGEEPAAPEVELLHQRAYR